MFIIAILKDSRKVRRIRNYVSKWNLYICISWYSKICQFPIKKCWYQQNSRGLSRDSYSFWIFFRQGITVPSLIIVGYACQILERGAPPPPPPYPWAAPKKPILNRVNIQIKFKQLLCLLVSLLSLMLSVTIVTLFSNFIFQRQLDHSLWHWTHHAVQNRQYWLLLSPWTLSCHKRKIMAIQLTDVFVILNVEGFHNSN